MYSQGERVMYYFEKDYIMRLIHGISQVLARFLLGRDLENGLPAALERECGEANDRFRAMVDSGQINAAENQLFELIDASGWEPAALGTLILLFYDYVNSKDDAFLEAASFSREEIITGREDALRRIGMEIPEYLKI